jgi:hypothetical protein
MADLALARLSSYLRKKLEGQEFTDVNQVMQRAIAHENRARDGRTLRRFKEGRKDRRGVASVW